MEVKFQDSDYQSLLLSISNRYEQGRANISAYVNTEIVSAYWQIGQYIVEFEQGGSSKAGYGKSLLENLSKDLISKFGKGFSRSNLNYMRLFYQLFLICEELPHKLSWTHFCELVKISDPLERSFYMQQSLLENWSTTELKRQKKSSLFLRLAASKDKEGILRLAKPQHSAGKRVGRFEVDSEKTQRKPWPATPATLALIQKSFASHVGITTFSISKSDATLCDAKTDSS